jgi:glutamate dehydrogenase (NADP+)
MAYNALETDKFLDEFTKRHPHMPEFHQAMADVAEDVIPHINARRNENEARILRYLSSPDRVISFRVTWQDDDNRMRFNQGFRVQYSNAMGVYKGGLRFHPGVDASVLHFLAFEQTLKNSLTGLPMGGAKGGADFDPKGRSDAEIRRFCQAFMIQLARHIGPDIDVPAGDIGVGIREIAWMFDQYRTVTGHFSGVLTGKHPTFGGSCFREEATGYGCVYLAQEVMKKRGDGLEGKSCALSGAGNVALHTARKLIDCDAKVITLSDSDGFVRFPEGIGRETLEQIADHKAQRGRLEALAGEEGWEFHSGEKPWSVPADLAFPCATQNELKESDARCLVENGCDAVFEAANMPCTSAASRVLRGAEVILVPSKAVNAGGVAVSGMEISQNRMRLRWPVERVDEELRKVMTDIHEACLEFGEDSRGVDYKRGANIAGFSRLAQVIDYYGVS